MAMKASSTAITTRPRQNPHRKFKTRFRQMEDEEMIHPSVPMRQAAIVEDVKPPTNVVDIEVARKKKDSRSGQEIEDEDRYEAWLAAFYLEDANLPDHVRPRNHRMVTRIINGDWDSTALACWHRQQRSEAHRLRIAELDPEREDPPPPPVLKPKTYLEGDRERYRPPTVQQLLCDAYSEGLRFCGSTPLMQHTEIFLCETSPSVEESPCEAQVRAEELAEINTKDVHKGWLPPVVEEEPFVSVMMPEPVDEKDSSELEQYGTPLSKEEEQKEEVPRGDIDYFITQYMDTYRKYDSPCTYSTDPHILFIRCCHEDETVGETLIVRPIPKLIRKPKVTPPPKRETYVEEHYSSSPREFATKVARSEYRRYVAWLRDPDASRGIQECEDMRKAGRNAHPYWVGKYFEDNSRKFDKQSYADYRDYIYWLEHGKSRLKQPPLKPWRNDKDALTYWLFKHDVHNRSSEFKTSWVQEAWTYLKSKADAVVDLLTVPAVEPPQTPITPLTIKEEVESTVSREEAEKVVLESPVKQPTVDQVAAILGREYEDMAKVLAWNAAARELDRLGISQEDFFKQNEDGVIMIPQTITDFVSDMDEDAPATLLFAKAANDE